MRKYLSAFLMFFSLTFGMWYFGFLATPKYWGGCDKEKILLEENDEVTCSIWVKKTDRYAVNIMYAFNSTDSDEVWRVKKIVEGISPETGLKVINKAPVKVQISIVQSDGANSLELVSGIFNPEKKSQGAQDINAEALRIELKPGNYEIRIKNVTAIPVMKTISSYVVFAPVYEGK